MYSINLLYPAIEEKLPQPTQYNILYRNMREDEPGDCGIYLYDSKDDVDSIDGNTAYSSVKAHIQVNAGKTLKDSFAAIDWLTEFVRRIESEPSAISGVEFVGVTHHGLPAKDVGQNDFGLYLVVSDIDIMYTIN